MSILYPHLIEVPVKSSEVFPLTSVGASPSSLDSSSFQLEMEFQTYEIGGKDSGDITESEWEATTFLLTLKTFSSLGGCHCVGLSVSHTCIFLGYLAEGKLKYFAVLCLISEVGPEY